MMIERRSRPLDLEEIARLRSLREKAMMVIERTMVGRKTKLLVIEEEEDLEEAIATIRPMRTLDLERTVVGKRTRPQDIEEEEGSRATTIRTERTMKEVIEKTQMVENILIPEVQEEDLVLEEEAVEELLTKEEAEKDSQISLVITSTTQKCLMLSWPTDLEMMTKIGELV
jgi:hypothetical protein